MSHPDPLYDPDNSYEDDEMNPNYDDYNDFYGESADYSDYNDDRDYEDDSMDGDFDSGMTSAGFGTDEDYGDDTPMYDDYYGGE